MISILKPLYASEWLAAYQYKVSANLLSGVPSLGIINKELLKHYEEEIKHADMLAERIIQLGGKPIKYFKNLEKYSPCEYPKILTTNNKQIITESLKGEICAIENYKKAIEIAKKNKDVITEQILIEILQDEEEHKTDLLKILL